MHSEESFDMRNNKKQKVHLRKWANYFVNPGEIWYAYVGLNIGKEVCGKGKGFTRPVLVMKQLGGMFLSIPMTTKGKLNHDFYYKISDDYFGIPSYLQLTQLRVFDKKRFTKHILTLGEDDMLVLKEKLREYYL